MEQVGSESSDSPDECRIEHRCDNKTMFKKIYPVIEGMLPFFVIMMTMLLYYNALLHMWPDSEALNEFSTWGINIIMDAHSDL